MQAVIVAAGKGTRLGCIGSRTPKCLLTVDGVPLLQHQLIKLRQAGITRATVVVGHLAERIEAFVKERDWGMPVRVVANPEYGETGGGASFLYGAREIDDDIIYLIGDMFYGDNLPQRLAIQAEAITLAIQLRACAPEDMKVRLDGAKVADISKRINPVEADGEFLGAAFVPREALPEFCDHMMRTLENPQKRTAHFGDMIRGWVETGYRVNWADLTDVIWCEIDSPRDLHRARRIAGR